MKTIFKILLFSFYPFSLYFLVQKSALSVVVGLCFSFIAFVIISQIKKKQTVIIDLSAATDERTNDFINYALFEKVILPEFVLQEAEKNKSDETLNKNIKKLKENKNVSLYAKDYKKLQNLELKTAHLAKELNAKIITTDFNLNKIAAVKGIKIIDLNDLYECLKPIALPGYKISVKLSKEGKDKNQAVGFLEDGTTVIAENGRHFIGQKVCLQVTSVLQTSSNKMLFGKVTKENFAENGTNI